MSLRPLFESPALYNLRWFDEFEVRAGYVAAEELEAAAGVRAFEVFRSGAREGCEAGGVGEGGVELGSRGAEFFG